MWWTHGHGPNSDLGRLPFPLAALAVTAAAANPEVQEVPPTIDPAPAIVFRPAGCGGLLAILPLCLDLGRPGGLLVAVAPGRIAAVQELCQVELQPP